MMTPLKAARAEFERQYLADQLELCGGNVAETARTVGMHREALYRKLNTLGVARPTARAERLTEAQWRQRQQVAA